MPDRNLKALVSKIILFYSVFYVIMKLIAVIFQNAWPISNLILTIPYIIFAVVGWVMLKRNYFSWIYVAAGVIVISVVRYFEAEWMVQMQQYFN
jgi:hypothetical protein